MENEVFISYSRKDTEFALKLRADLEKQGISIWIDQGDIVAGDAWRKQIVEGIEGCRVFLIVLSPHSAVSANVVKELSLAESNRKKIIPILYQPVDIPKDMEYQLSGLQYQAFNEGRYEDNLARLIAVIKSQPVPKVLPSETVASTPTQRIAPSRGGVSTGMIIGIGCAFILLGLAIGTGIFFVTQSSSTPIAKVPPVPTTVTPITPASVTIPPRPTTITPTYTPAATPTWTPTRTPTPTPTAFLAVANGLVAYYPFNGDALDHVGKHNGIIYGPLPTLGRDGKSNSAFQFDGKNDYMEIPDSNDLDFSRNDFSLSVWLKYGVQTHEDGLTYSAVFIKSAQENAPWTGVSFFVDTPAPGTLLFRVDLNNYVDTSNSKYNDNVFRNFVLVRNNNNLQIFVNGSLVNQKLVTSTDVSNIAKVVLGANHVNRSTQNYIGVMENLRIYNRALSASEALQIYQSGQ